MIVMSCVVVILGSFAVTIPSSPGFIGTYHLAVQGGLTIFGVDPSIGFAYAVLLHFTAVIPITIIGFYFFLNENIKYASIKTEKYKPSENGLTKQTISK